MLFDFFALGLNNFRRRKLRSWLTMVGIFIGIAAVVALIDLGQGLKEALTGQFSSLSVDILSIENSGTGFGPPGSTVVRKLNERDLKLIKNVQGVDEAIVRLIRIGKIEFNRASDFHYLTNVPESEKQIHIIYDSFGLKMAEGRQLKYNDYGKVVIGSSVAEKENFGKTIRIGNKIRIEGKEFEVVGIIKKTSNIIFNRVTFITERDLKDILDIDDEIDLIAVKVENPDKTQDVAERIEKVLRKDRGLKEGEEDFSVQTPLEALSAVNTILTILNIVVSGIAAISLIVGGIGIANTMYTSVLERNKEIGTMKAIGAKNSDVLIIFLIESGLLGLVGGIIGVLIGVGISMLVSYSTNSYFGAEIIASDISSQLVLGAIAFSFFIGVLSGTIPSIQASKLKPAEALRR